MLRLHIFLLMVIISAAEENNQKIVGGRETTIEKYPHSVFMRFKANNNSGHVYHNFCGGSIVNQLLILTAAHCIDDTLETLKCPKQDEHKCLQIVAFFGQTRMPSSKAVMRYASTWATHEKYYHEEFIADLAIIKVRKPIPLGKTMSRVAIMRYPPYDEQPWVAGWGRPSFEEETPKSSGVLKELEIRPLNDAECKKPLGFHHKGAICTIAKGNETHEGAYRGDSGSALVVRHNRYIQIGVFSHFAISGIKKNEKKHHVYMDVGYYSDWIKKTAKRLYCARY